MKLIKGLVGILVHNQLGMSVSGEHLLSRSKLAYSSVIFIGPCVSHMLCTLRACSLKFVFAGFVVWLPISTYS